MECSWCDRPATYFLLSDRDSRNSVDHACDEHTAQWRHLYRRAVPVPVSGPTQGAPSTPAAPGSRSGEPVSVDLRESHVVDLRDVDADADVAVGVGVPAPRPDVDLAEPAGGAAGAAPGRRD